MLHINDLTYRIEGRLILDKATVGIPTGHKVGFVGRNGTGKSTLLRLIAGEISPDDGGIRLPRGTRIGWVTQRDRRCWPWSRRPPERGEIRQSPHNDKEPTGMEQQYYSSERADMLPFVPRVASYLDLGCGEGPYLDALAAQRQPSPGPLYVQVADVQALALLVGRAAARAWAPGQLQVLHETAEIGRAHV